MQRSLRVTQVFAGLLSLGCFVAPSHAQDISKEGKFSATFTTVNPNPVKPITLGNHEIGGGSVIITIINDTETGFLHAMAGHCNALVDHDHTAKTFQGEGYCNVTNQNGDQIFLGFKTASPVALGITVPLKGRILGGTGKFAGVTGEFDIRRSPVLASEELVVTAGKLVGSYSIGK